MSALLDEMLSNLEIREINSVLPHEQIVSYNLKRLKEAMLNVGQLVDPLIVDKKSGVVLDGHHRLKVLQMLESPNIVCQTVNYQSPEISLDTWYPSTSLSIDELLHLDSVKYEKVDYAAGKKAVDALKAPFMITNKKGECHLINPGAYKLIEMVAEQNYLFSLLSKTELEYIAQVDVQKHLESGRTIFYRRTYAKDEVVKTAQAHSPFPPKSTRHLIPGRIIRLNMRLGWLNHSKEDAMKELTTMLENRVYAGNVRKYFEPVIVIY